jgi:hypothetical protein
MYGKLGLYVKAETKWEGGHAIRWMDLPVQLLPIWDQSWGRRRKKTLN